MAVGMHKVTCLGNSFSGMVTFSEHEIKPIKVTEELLVEFGFEIQHDTPFYSMVARRKNGLNMFTDNDNEGFWNFAGIKRVQIKYVHQLQNLFFTFFGEELK